MKFKQIRFCNFMRYYGENIIKFSTDSQKNVTVILGNNTFGKTTIAQAFRWGLYGEVTTTNYTNKKNIVLLNNEAIAEMSVNSNKDILVEIIVESGDAEYTFTRKQTFRKKNPDPNNFDICPVGESRLSMIISENGDISERIRNEGNGKQYKIGCVSETINNMFPNKLSNYFFFDGERWNDNKNKSAEIKQSINTILGVSPIVKMKEHLKDGNADYKTTVIKKLNASIKGTSSESADIKRRIDGFETIIRGLEADIENYDEEIRVAGRDINNYGEILNNNRSTEEDQKEINSLKEKILSDTKRKNLQYNDIVKLFSSADKLFASDLLPTINHILSQVNLEGKDIPGVTSDTIDYLINTGNCLCGEKLIPEHEHYESLMQLREEVYPNKIGGPAKILRARLEEWAENSINLIESMHEKVENFENYLIEINASERRCEKIEERIDRTFDLGNVRKAYNRAVLNEKKARDNKSDAEAKIQSHRVSIESLQKQLQNLEEQDKNNAPIYRAIEYANALYSKASKYIDMYERPTLHELNEIIGKNFEKMFNSKDKYACLENDYKIHMFYRSVGGFSDYEEENLSNGETIAINFVYIVSILELAKKRKDKEMEKEAVLSLPLVLDAPFSNLSNENTSLVAQKLPEFAEQVIIFMLDKDWNASGLKQFTMPEYCYRVSRDFADNSSSITNDGGSL